MLSNLDRLLIRRFIRENDTSHMEAEDYFKLMMQIEGSKEKAERATANHELRRLQRQARRTRNG